MKYKFWFNFGNVSMLLKANSRVTCNFQKYKGQFIMQKGQVLHYSSDQPISNIYNNIYLPALGKSTTIRNNLVTRAKRAHNC